MRKRVWLLPLLALLLLGPDWGYVVRTEYRLETADLPEAFSGLRVAVVSDLHGRRLGRNHERLLRALRAAGPDLIAVTGDLVDEHTDRPLEYAAGIGGALAQIAPVYYVTGNHEWAARQAEDICDALEGAGVTCLRNGTVPVERSGARILVTGLDDPNAYADQKTPEQVTQELRGPCGENDSV